MRGKEEREAGPETRGGFYVFEDVGHFYLFIYLFIHCFRIDILAASSSKFLRFQYWEAREIDEYIENTFD